MGRTFARGGSGRGAFPGTGTTSVCLSHGRPHTLGTQPPPSSGRPRGALGSVAGEARASSARPTSSITSRYLGQPHLVLFSEI